MATNIEQIFRSFVISKFREIQDQQFVGRKSGSQHNGEINSPDRVEPSDDTIPSIGNLQVDPLVQKIEQVLSEVLSAESQYKPDVGENIIRSKSAKRSLSEEVRDEIPRKKSKKDKKHKEKKKKKKRKKDKKDKKYKKESKESKPNAQEKERGELQHITHSESENSLAILSVEDDMDMQLTPTVTQTSVCMQEKPVYVNTAVSNSYETDSDRNRSDLSKEHSASVIIHESTKAEVVHERELENGPSQPTNLAVDLLPEDASLKITDTGDGGVCMIKTGTPSIEETGVNSALAATEKVNVPENRSYIARAEQEHLDTGLESAMLEAKRLDSVTESLNTESMKQSVSVSSEIYPRTPLETPAEAKDSVTALGFLAMVVGKDFEATSEFLNTAKLKASERSPKHISDMKNDVISDFERLVPQDLQKTLQVNSRAEFKDLPSSESQHGAFEKDSEPISVTKPKLPEEELKKPAESGAQKCMTMVSDGETVTGMRQLRETLVSEIMTELKDSGKSPRNLQTITDGKDVRRTTDLQLTNRKYLSAYVPDRTIEAENTAPPPLAIMGARNVEPSTACEKTVQMKCLEPFVEAVIEKKRVIEVNVPESIPQLEDVAERNDLETISKTADSVKPQNLEISKCINLQEVENEGVVNLKDLKKDSESPVTMKNVESIPESQHVKDVLQSTTVAQKKDFQTNLELEGEKKEKDIDAASDSLHMIFTNYSEHSLEPNTEPTVELKNSERVPELLVRADTNSRKEQHIRESKELTSIESELNDELNDLQKIECLHRNKRNVKEAMESKAAPAGKDSDTLEAVPKGGQMDTIPHFVAGIEEKVSDICESMEKNQHDAEADLHELSRCQKITKKSSERPGESMLFAESKSLFTAESLQEMNILRSGMAPKLKTVGPMQGLKEIVGFAAGMEVVSQEKKLDVKISESSGSKDYSKFISTVKQVEPVAESHAEQNIEPLQQTNKNTKNINLGIMCDFDIKHDNANAEKWFSVELNNQKEKQTLEARSETAGMTTVPKLLYGSAKDPVIVSETDEINRVIVSERHPDPVRLGKINSENIVKPLYLIQMKDSQTISESRIVDVKALETDSGATFKAGAASADLQEGELKVSSEIKTTSESPKKNEISLGLQSVLVLQEPDKAFRNKALAFTNLDAPSETHHTCNTENLEIPPQREELEVKKSEGALPFVFVVDMVEGTTDKGKLDADTATERVLTTEKSRAPTESADMLGKTFEPTCMTNLKYLEASQKLKTHLESLDRKETNYVFSGSSTVMNASETLKNEGKHVLDNVWKDTNKVKEKHSGTDLEPDAALVVKNSESVLESITDSEKKDGDTSMAAVKVTDLETSSSNLDTTQTSNLKTTLQIEMTSKPVCTLQSRDSDSVIESVSKIKTKDLGQAVNAEKILQVKDSVTATEQLNTLELKSLALTSGPEVTDCAKIPDLKTTPRCLVTAHSTCSSTVAEMKALEAVDSGTHLKPENTSEVNLSETTLEIDKERHDYVAVSRSEAMIEEASEPVSEVVCLSNVEDLKSTSEPKHVEIVQSSEKPLQLLFKSKCSAVTVESAKMSDLQNTSADVGPVSFTGEKYPKTASEIVSPAGVKNSKSSSEVIVALNDKELFLKSGNILQFADSVESKDFEAANKCVTLEEVGDLQVASVSTGEEVQMVSEGTAKTMLDLESQKLEQSSTSEVLEKTLNEVTVESSHAVCTKDSEPVPEHISAKNIDISEQHSKCLSIREVKDIDSSAKYVILTEAKILEVIPQFIGKMKDSETTLEQLNTAKEKDLGGIPHVSLDEEGLKTAAKPVCTAIQNLEANEQLSFVLKDSEPECVQRSEKDLKASEKDSEPTIESLQKEKDRNLKATVEDSLKDHDSEAASKSLDITKEDEESTLKDKKSEKISSKTKDKSKSGKKAKKSRSKSLSKSKKRKKKTRSRSVSRLVSSRRARSRSKNDSDSKKKHSTSRHKSRSKSTDRKEKESSLRSKRRRSRSPDRLKSRSKSVDKREISVRSRRRRSKSSDHRKSRSRSVDRRESVRRRRRLSRSSDNHRSRSRSIDRRDTLIRTRRRRSRSSDRKSRSQSADRREISVRRKQRRSLSSDRCKSRSRSLDRRESSIRTRRRRSRSSDHHKSRSRSADDKRESPVRTRRRRSRSPDTRKSRSRSFDRRARRRRSRSSDNRKSRSRSADRRETSVRVRRRRSRSSDNRRSKSKSVDKRETPLRARRRRSRSSDNRRSKSKSIDRKETPVRPRRRRSVSSGRKSRSKSVDKRETSVRAKRKRSKSPDGKSRTKSVEKGEPPLKTRRRRSKSSDHHVSRSKSRSSERKKDKDSSDGSREKHTKYRSKSKSLENTERTESVEATIHNRSRSPEPHKSKSKSRSKSIDKTGESQSLRRSRSKSSKSPETRSHRRRTVSRSRRNRSRSLTRKRASRSKSNHRSRTHSRTRSRSCSRRWRRTRSRSASRQRSLSRERRRRSRRNRSRSVDRRRRRSDSRDSYRLSLRLRSRSRTPVRLRCSRSIGRRRSPSKSPDHRRSSSRSPKRLTDLDKAQLLEIAKANAAAMCAKAGVPLPPSLMPVVTPEKKEEKVTQKSAKETILELTEKCKKIAQSQDDVIVNKPHVSDEEEEEHPFINHPFKLNEPKPIFFNLTTPTIKPAAPKNQVTLTKEFPVSSGSQHRKKEADSAYGEWVPVEKNKDEKKDDVFPNPANLEPVDISSALTERTIAQKRLTENTFDLEAMCLLNRAQERIDAWAELNSIPGHFTGSTGAQVLTSEQLANSGPQAWVKKDQFLRAAPVSGGMGAQLMRKMGWREGEGLGKNKEGNKEPILVDFKTDRKGLVAIGERMQKRHGPFGAVKDLSGKHPVSALLEVCNKRRWSPPVFVLVNDSRPEYRKHFLFKVMVNGVEYKPSFVSPNKKHAKATAATVALQALGLVPKDLLANATNFRSASHS